MQQLSEQQQKFQINIKRSIPGKFFKQLNYQTNQKLKKQKRRAKNKSQMSCKKIQKHEQYGLNYDYKPSKKAIESNKNGNRIIANYKNNQMHGDVQIYYQNGTIFKGQYQNGIKIKGHFVFPSGYQYIGNCLGNKFNGEGCLIFPSGKMMSGQWKNYQIIGLAKVEYPQGEVYYGEVRDYKKHGNGYFFFNDNSKYVGQFKYGLITGRGSYYQNDVLIEEGEWFDGQLINAGQVKREQKEQSGQRRQKGLSIDDIMIQKIQMGESFFNQNMNICQEANLQPIIKIKKSVKKVCFNVNN